MNLNLNLIDSTNNRLVQEIVVLVFHRCLYNKQNITCPLVDTNFNLLMQSSRYLTRSNILCIYISIYIPVYIYLIDCSYL